MKIAIDGPSASGKGTVSKLLAKQLNAFYLNTGKIYRIVAFLAAKQTGDITQNALEVAKNIDFHFNAEAENNEIYTEENAKIASSIAQNAALRTILNVFQTNFAQNHQNIILEGRDIGTVIMPNADYKFFLDANAAERARRRLLQSGKELTEENIKQTTQMILERDEADTKRQNASLKIAPDAIYIDTSEKSVEEVINEMLSIILKK